jgi:hypothetical protein
MLLFVVKKIEEMESEKCIKNKVRQFHADLI